MTETKEQENSPTKLFVEEINKFTRDIDCLYFTLPLFMFVAVAMQKKAHEDVGNFITGKCTGIKESNGTTSYSVPVDDMAEHTKLTRKNDTAATATLLVPRHFVTSLVSQYDSFLGSVMKFIFAVKPEKLNASEKSIPFTELIKFKNIDEAKEYIIEKEVEAVIRKSHVEQFSWLKDTFGTPFNKDLKSWPIFIELTERRNLFVHCDGKVSSQYLSVCANYNCNIEKNVELGTKIDVNPKYFEKANDCIYEIGIKMAHVIWRRLTPDKLTESDENIVDITYGLVENGRYKLAIELLEFFTQPQMKHADETYKRMMIINLAQAYKWFNDRKNCEKVLNQLDWSACEDRFKLAVAVLKDEYDDVYRYMRCLRHDESFYKAYYKDWPVFKELRKQEMFKKVYCECYGEEFIVTKSIEEETVKIKDALEIDS